MSSRSLIRLKKAMDKMLNINIGIDEMMTAGTERIMAKMEPMASPRLPLSLFRMEMVKLLLAMNIKQNMWVILEKKK